MAQDETPEPSASASGSSSSSAAAAAAAPAARLNAAAPEFTPRSGPQHHGGNSHRRGSHHQNHHHHHQHYQPRHQHQGGEDEGSAAAAGEDKEGPAQPRLSDAEARKVVKQVAFSTLRSIALLPAVLLYLRVDCERWLVRIWSVART